MIPLSSFFKDYFVSRTFQLLLGAIFCSTPSIDLSDVSITSGFRVENLKKIYSVFEPNYPETLSKMVMYPVSTMLGTTARTLLSFVNEKTQKKFVITNSLDKVCEELGWSKAEVEECGGIAQFMEKHEEQSTMMVFK